MLDFQSITTESSKARFLNSNSQGYFFKGIKRRNSYIYNSGTHCFAGIGVEIFVGNNVVFLTIGLDVLTSTALPVWVEL